jgi:digeranylgeranylglycerophospholipid reductase
LNGYGWIFPKKDHINIGIGEIGKSEFNLKNIFSKYIQMLKNDKIIPESIKLGTIKGGALPIHPVDKTYSNRVILCGDSAGFINPLTGEGIDFAMYSGKIASDVLIKALEKENFTEHFLKKYEKLWKKSFGKDLHYYMHTAKQWNFDNEELFEIVSNDNILSNLLMDIATGNRKISEIKGKIIRRYLKIKIKKYFKNS